MHEVLFMNNTIKTGKHNKVISKVEHFGACIYWCVCVDSISHIHENDLKFKMKIVILRENNNLF